MLIKFDKDFFLWCNQFQQNPEALTVFRSISRTGDGPYYALLAIVIYVLGGNHNHSFVYTALIAFAIEIPSFLLLKHFIKRDRPAINIPTAKQAVQPADKFSLPSGHSSAAFAMATLIAVYYPLYADIALCWASLIAASRVLLGVHYLTDVLAGAALGSSCTYAAILLFGLF